MTEVLEYVPGITERRPSDLRSPTVWRKGNPDKDHTTTRALAYNSAWLATSFNIPSTYDENLIHLSCQHR